MIRFLFRLLLWFADIYTSDAFVPATEISLLYTLYNQTDGGHWVWRSISRFGPIWNFSNPDLNPCSTSGEYWQGISCSSPPIICANISCSITHLDLERYGLQHELPVHWKEFSLLTHLDLSDNHLIGNFPLFLPSTLLFLDLSDNQLSSSIPVSFGELVNLSYLDLESNMLWHSLPSTIVHLSSLTSLSIYTNRFSGALPVDIGLMTSLKHLDIEDNYFSGQIPTSFGNLKFLSYFDLSINFFSNSIPSELALMPSVEYFSVELNTLTGTIPSSLGLATSLTSLTLEENYFTSSLPSTLGSLSRLKMLSLYLNSLTGTLPSTLGSLQQVSWIELGRNLFSGSLFPMGRLSELQIFSIFENLFTSAVPCDFNSLDKLNYLDLSVNHFDCVCENLSFGSKLERLELFRNSIRGSISDSFFSNLHSLEFFDYSDNFLTGTIPSNLNSMTQLGHLSLGKNRLSGTLPSTLVSLTLLVQLYLAENHLGGSLTSPFISSSNMSLINVDLSSNLFKGEIPMELFQIPSLETLALTSNCFHGSIPEAICDGRLLHVISMDGLGAASGCDGDINFIFNNLFEGNIPSCLWNLQNLTVLSLSGNGLTGSISSVSPPPSLRNLTLSHNHLSGSAPTSFQNHYFHHLDLSYNKLRGELSFYLPLPLPSSITQRLILEVNRLSGSLTVFPHQQASLFLNILTGNIFSCQDIPSSDVDYQSYSCGSLVLDEALITVCVVVGLSALIFLLYQTLAHSLTSHGRRIGDQVSELKDYLSILDRIQVSIISKELHELSISMNFLQYLEKITFLLVILCIVLPLPVYGLRWTNGSFYSTHSHLYRWTGTAAYLTGLVPATLLMISWMIAITVFIYLLRRMKNSTTATGATEFSHLNSFSSTDTSFVLPTELSVRWKKLFKEYAMTGIVILINLTAIGAMNALYIVSTTQRNSSLVDFWIKVCVAVFKVLWNSLYLPLLDHSKYRQRLQILTRVLNSILIPCIATALSSPACFQGLLVKSDPITSSYQFNECLNFSRYPSGLLCTAYRIAVIDLAPFIPSFSYNYLCGSTLLAAYLPVYLYVYTLQLITPFLSTVLLTRYLPYHRLPPWLRKKFPGVLWPHHWLAQNRYRNHTQEKASPQERPLPSLLLRMDNIMTSHMQDLLILLTFGLCCPLLAIVIGLSINISIWQVRLVVGRFVFQRNPSLKNFKVEENLSSSPPWAIRPSPVASPCLASTSLRPESVSVSQSDLSLIALTAVISDLGRSYHQVLWVLVWSSCVFWAFLCWDISGDEVGWNYCYWIPLTAIGYISLIRLVISAGRNQALVGGGREEIDLDGEVSMIYERRTSVGAEVDEEDEDTGRSVIELNARPI